VDGYGEATYGAPVTYRARVVGTRKLVRNLLGEEVVSSHTIYLASPTPAIGPRDRLTLSTSDMQSTETSVIQPPILSLGIFPDDLGRTHVVAYCA
jgi:hypothetical protein